MLGVAAAGSKFLSASQTPMLTWCHCHCFICLCSKAWASAFAYILWGSHLVNYLVTIPPPFGLLSQFFLWEFRGKSLNLIPITGILQPLPINLRSRLPTVRLSRISLSKFLTPFPPYTPILYLAECLPKPCLFTLSILWAEIPLSTGPVPQCLFRSSG